MDTIFFGYVLANVLRTRLDTIIVIFVSYCKSIEERLDAFIDIFCKSMDSKTILYIIWICCKLLYMY